MPTSTAMIASSGAARVRAAKIAAEFTPRPRSSARRRSFSARQIRQRELQETQRQAFLPVFAALRPILEAVVAERDIDILVDRSNLVFASTDVDITDVVIERLNTTLPSVPVNRVRMPQGEAGAGPSGYGRDADAAAASRCAGR